MKIDRLRSRTVWASSERSWLFVEVHTDSGLIGRGEASQSRNDEGVEAELRALEPQYVGADPLDLIARRRSLLDWPYVGRTLFAAVSAIEQALWDLAGKALGVPVYQLIGGAAGHRVRAYANIGYAARSRSPSALAEAAAAAVRDGFDAIKLYPFGMRPHGMTAGEEARWIDSGIACARAAREAVGDRGDVLVDLMHQFAELKQIRDVLRRMDDCNFFWVEDPFVSDHPAQLAELRQAIGPRLAGGAPLIARHEWRPLIESRALDVIMPDVKWVGGIQAAQHLAAMAEIYGIQVSPHNASGPVATSASVHLSFNLPNFSLIEYAWGVPDWRSALCRGSEVLTAGSFPLPQAPGLGIDIDADIAALHAERPPATQERGIVLPRN
ncbi:MAG: mandelate racemase/muconate lactonizing enzyme family protein [Lautropia sp.]